MARVVTLSTTVGAMLCAAQPSLFEAKTMTDALSRLRETVRRATGGEWKRNDLQDYSGITVEFFKGDIHTVAHVGSVADVELILQAVRLVRAIANRGAVDVLARAIIAQDSGPEGSRLFDIHWAEFGEGATQTAQAVLEALAKVAVGE